MKGWYNASGDKTKSEKRKAQNHNSKFKTYLSYSVQRLAYSSIVRVSYKKK